MMDDMCSVVYTIITQSATQIITGVSWIQTLFQQNKYKAVITDTMNAVNAGKHVIELVKH